MSLDKWSEIIADLGEKRQQEAEEYIRVFREMLPGCIAALPDMHMSVLLEGWRQFTAGHSDPRRVAAHMEYAEAMYLEMMKRTGHSAPIVFRFPGIRAIAGIIAYDNGMVNRDYNEWQFWESLDPILGADGVYEEDLRLLDTWCQALTPEEQETVGAGEATECEAIENRHPRPELFGIFNDIFEKGGSS